MQQTDAHVHSRFLGQNLNMPLSIMRTTIDTERATMDFKEAKNVIAW